ncbi:MAG: heavy-metal-associated domain-containing protein [Candidatus Margulisiibacteriota bacterium]
MIKKLLSLLLSLVFLSGVLPLSPPHLPSEAKVRKATYRKISPKRKIIQKKKHKVRYPKKKAKKKTRRYPKARRRTLRRAYPKLAKFGRISQVLLLEEGFDELEADRITDALKTLGVESVTTKVETNTVKVQFNTSKLSTVRIIQKLRELGYTVKQIQ